MIARTANDSLTTYTGLYGARAGMPVSNSSGCTTPTAAPTRRARSPAGTGFPGFGSFGAAQTLAYMADMQESGVPVTYGYISDIHGNERP